MQSDTKASTERTPQPDGRSLTELFDMLGTPRLAGAARVFDRPTPPAEKD